jgi:hypothetical protein
MKQPAVKLEVVYKVVRYDDKGMWSANANSSEVKFGSGKYRITYDDRYMVQYRMNHQVLPNVETPRLFACPSLAEARKALAFYGDKRYWENAESKINGAHILKCLAANCRHYQENDDIREGPNISTGAYYGTAVVTCDWLIPVAVVTATKKS